MTESNLSCVAARVVELVVGTKQVGGRVGHRRGKYFMSSEGFRAGELRRLRGTVRVARRIHDVVRRVGVLTIHIGCSHSMPKKEPIFQATETRMSHGW